MGIVLEWPGWGLQTELAPDERQILSDARHELIGVYYQSLHVNPAHFLSASFSHIRVLLL